MKKFSLPNGTTGFTDDSGKWVCTGSQMGRRNILPDDAKTFPAKMRLIRLSFVDGCYDRWGAYWGSPANIYCATGDCAEEVAFVFVRADSRDQAKSKVRESMPRAKFYR